MVHCCPVLWLVIWVWVVAYEFHLSEHTNAVVEPEIHLILAANRMELRGQSY
ncbi:hypothetical protein M758_9G111000 [Ceratodon purpureus]|nr:hypothetical protein M758_9G111000 [Ceratodon purpureus]